MTTTPVSAPRDGDAVADRTPGGPGEAPAGTTTLFGLLVAAVVASAFTVYGALYGAVPRNLRRFWDVVDACVAGEPVLARPTNENFNLVAWHTEALHRVAACETPLYREQALWVLCGVAVLFGLAGLIYLVHPWWIIRRHGLIPVREQDYAGVPAYLATLSQRAGLARPPTFLVDPHATSDGGTAFGRIGRRYVHLDPAVLDRYGGDRDAFRVIVLHELAHHRNRDVDVTYLTIAIWWSFVAVALIPAVLVTAHPRILSDPLRWPSNDLSLATAAPVWVALLLLTAIVYLTRNALLRVREIYADARVATYGDAEAVRRGLSATSQPSTTGRWRGVAALFSTHPKLDERVRAIDDPAGAFARPRLWELVGVGAATAMIATNLRFYLGQVMPTLFGTSDLVVGLVVVPALVAPLGVVIWRATVGAPTGRLSTRAVVLPSLALTAGFLIGEQVTLHRAWTFGPPADLYGWIAAAVILIAIGTVMLARWMAAAIRMVLRRPGTTSRFAVPVVIAVGALAAAPWFAAWFAVHDSQALLVDAGLGVGPSTAPFDAATANADQLVLSGAVPGIVGTVIDWFATLSRWVSVRYTALEEVITNPLTGPGLALLWLAPVALTRWRRGNHTGGHPPTGWRTVLLASLVGAAVNFAVCVGLGYAATSFVPSELRSTGAFAITGWMTFLALAILTVAGVVMVVSALNRGRWVGAVPLAVVATGTLTAIVREFAIAPLTRCIDVYANATRGCIPPFDAVPAAYAAHQTIVDGALLAVPAALLGAAIGIRRRRRAAAASPLANEEPPPPSRRTLVRAMPVAAGLALAAVVIAAAAAETPRTYREWFTPGQNIGFAPRGPAFLMGLSSVDPCVVGTWVETLRESYETIDGVEVRFTGKGARQRFGLDGAAVVDFGGGNVQTGKSNGHSWRRITTGTITYRYVTRDGSIILDNPSPAGTVTVTMDGTTKATHPLQASGPQSYTCRGDALSQIDESVSFADAVDLKRINREPGIPQPAVAPAAGSSSADPCIVGTWTEVSHRSYFVQYGEWVQLTSAGLVQRFDADGTAVLDFGTGKTEAGDVHGQWVEITTRGRVEFRYHIQDGQIFYDNPTADGTTEITVDGQVRSEDRLRASAQSEYYSCSGDTLKQVSDTYEVELKRDPPT